VVVPTEGILVPKAEEMKKEEWLATKQENDSGNRVYPKPTPQHEFRPQNTSNAARQAASSRNYQQPGKRGMDH